MVHSITSSGSPCIDIVLGGGFGSGTVTELCGESDSGKTQVCLQSCLTVQLPPNLGGLYASSFYIHTNGPFPINRLHQMSIRMEKLHKGHHNQLDFIQVRKVNSIHELLFVIKQLERHIIESFNECHPIRLVVIDSVSSLCRTEFAHTIEGMQRRKVVLNKLSAQLKLVASTCNVAFVLTNEVSDAIETSSSAFDPREQVYSSGRLVKACLGPHWRQSIDTRLFFSIPAAKTQICSRRRVVVASSTYLPITSATFSIAESGVH